MSLQIDADLPSTIEFAFDRAPFPLLRSLGLAHEGDYQHDGLVLELSCDPAFFERKLVKVQSLPAHSTQSLGEILVNLKADCFIKLPEQREAAVYIRLKKGEEVLAEQTHAVFIIPPQPHLSLTYDHSINYAFQQNAIPVVKELLFRNNGVARKDLVLRVSTEPAFAPAIEIRLQSIDPAGEFRVSPLDLKLSHGGFKLLGNI